MATCGAKRSWSCRRQAPRIEPQLLAKIFSCKGFGNATINIVNELYNLLPERRKQQRALNLWAINKAAATRICSFLPYALGLTRPCVPTTNLYLVTSSPLLLRGFPSGVMRVARRLLLGA